VVQVESHPYLPETELLEYCKQNGIVLLAFAPLGHGMKPGLLEDPVILAIAARVGKTPAQVLLAWAVQRGTALLTTPTTAARARENFNISALPQDALDQINRIQTRQRLNTVVTSGVPGFIPRGGWAMAKLTSFQSDIRPLFTERDIQGMSKAFNLGSYDDVKKHAAAIYDRIRGIGGAVMPPPPPRGEGPWPQSRIELFAKWMADGFPH
jgi:hypothetical protein